MIRPCNFDDADDFEAIYDIINHSAEIYRDIIPAEQWTVPYFSRLELQQEIDRGVAFWGYEEIGSLIAVMGIQDVLDATLIRYLYVQRGRRGKGIGSEFMAFLRQMTSRPLLANAFFNAAKAIHFYELHGFLPVAPEPRNRLIKAYWPASDHRIEAYAVLADQKARDTLLTRNP
jgi:GNAT superfamily N-acetyltransferase